LADLREFPDMPNKPLSPSGDGAIRGERGRGKEGNFMLAIFQLGGESLAVETAAVQEIALMARLSKPNGLPALIAGFLNLAQKSVPVLRLDRLLRLPEPTFELYTQILILRDAAKRPMGWIVDRVAQVVTVRRDEVLPVPENHCFQDCATGVLVRNETSISILAPERVLLERERRCMQEFQAREEERLRELEPTSA
jgi:purine-binding chemotaxis protein CheW